jgi:hypothetical protein
MEFGPESGTHANAESPVTSRRHNVIYPLPGKKS